MNHVAKLLTVLIVLMGTLYAQTATVSPSHNTTTLPYNGLAVPVHLAWGPAFPPAGWTVVDYCIGESSTSGQEHASHTIGGIVYKGCGAHVTGTSVDVYPFLGQHYWVVWAELISTDGTKIAFTTDSNEASCDFEVLSETATLTTYYCKGAVVGNAPNPPGLTGNWN